MYNKFIDRLLDNDPKQVLSKGSIRARKIISPILRFAIPFVTPNSKLRVLRRVKLPKQPVIFAPTHGFREDIEHTLLMAGRQAYVLNGSLTQLYRSIDGVASWLAGVIPIDRTKKESRASAKKKLVYALELGASVIMYPEGTWNKSPNQLMSGLFPGVYDVAKESRALVVPIATYRNGKNAYGIMEEAFDICTYDRTTGIQVLRDKLATMQYGLMEQYGQAKRTDFPCGEEADAYWKSYVDNLMAQVKYYDYDVELHTKYVDKNITSPQEAFAHLEYLEVKKENAFLWRQ